MKVIIVDDQEILRQGLAMIVASDISIEVVGQGSDGNEALMLCDTRDVDVVLMDIRMPNKNGVEATKLIKKHHPNIKVLILTTFLEDDYIFGSLENGASGYLLKDAPPEDIIQGIKTVYEGGAWMNPSVATKVVAKLAGDSSQQRMKVDRKVSLLTSRELDICHFLGEGLNNREIGEALYISEGTVKNNITKVLDKLELRDRTQLALFAVKNGL